MVINRDGLITENNELLDNNSPCTEELEVNKEFDNKSTEIENVLSDEQKNTEIVFENNIVDSSIPDNISETVQQSVELCKKETVETNCLALTVRKDYNLSIVKNTILTTFRFSWKIAFSTLVLNILKLFF